MINTSVVEYDPLTGCFFITVFGLCFFVLSLYRVWGQAPAALNLRNPEPEVDLTLAFDALQQAIEMQLDGLFRDHFGQFFVLPEGLTLPAVGEHIYGGVETLAGLQTIYLQLFFRGTESPYFHQAMELLMQHLV